MLEGVMQVERVLIAIGQHHSDDAAKLVCQLLAAILRERNYPRADEAAAELEQLRPAIDYLLLMRAVEGGCFRLQTDDMQVTLRPLYNPTGDEDLSLPPVGVLGDLPADAAVSLVIERNPAISIDERIVTQVTQAGRLQALKIEVELPAEEKQGQTFAVDPPITQLQQVLAALHLAADGLMQEATELVESHRLWQMEEALVAYTIIVKKLRIIVGTLEHGQPVDVSKIALHVERAETTTYRCGVYLAPPYTKRIRWSQDRSGYRDFHVGNVPLDKLDEASHFLLE